nr:neutral and basic amino acid transport protein rBAT [Leptinotarsa decemlineata]
MDDKIEAKPTYKAIPEKDMEEEAVSRPKLLTKLLSSGESDGADEKMLPDEKVSHKSDISLKDVKISNEKNGDAKLDIGEPMLSFGGMNKEELMKYANDPFWVRLRWFLFIGFWLLWAAMLVGAILIIYAAPKCDPPPPRTWWQEGPLALVSPDTNPEQLKTLDKNIKGLIVSWQGDAYKEFDESHDVIKILNQAKDLGRRTIIELDPSSSEVWFEESENKNISYKDYYIWRAAKGTGDGTPQPPNNWVDKNDNSSWHYSEKRQEYYYAPLNKKILNFRNASVVAEFSAVINKFLGFGASGIRLRNAPILLVDEKYEDETPDQSNAEHSAIKQYGFYLHSKTENLPELGDLLKTWKKIVRNKTVDGPLMVADELVKVQSYHAKDNLLAVDLPVKTHSFDKRNVSDIVNNLNYTFNVDNVEWPLWKINSTSLPSDVVDIITYLLPGTTLVGVNATIDPQLLKIRESPSIMRGICSLHSIHNNTVFAFIRVTSGNPGVLVALNTGDQKVVVNFQTDVPALSELQKVTIQHYSRNFNEPDYKSINAKVDATAVPISPKSVIVFSYVPKKNE